MMVTTTVLIYFLHPSNSKRMANVANTGVASESLNDVAAMESSYELKRYSDKSFLKFILLIPESNLVI
jgi:hypothetical protein